MVKYCLDTSGLSNPWETLPEDIYSNLWTQVIVACKSGIFCYNSEIYGELNSITGKLGACLKEYGRDFILEIGDDSWDWATYLDHNERMSSQYKQFISEYNGNRKGTVGLTDLSIIALAKTLGIPLISMEKANLLQPSAKKRRIPDICADENVAHMDFNDFLRAEGIRA